MRKNSLKRILSLIFCIVLVLSYCPMEVWAIEESVTDVNAVSIEERTVTTEAEFLAALEDESVAVINLGNTISIQAEQGTLTDDALMIPRSVTIQGGELNLESAGIILGGDVTFKNMTIYFANPVRNAIIANGHSLTLDTVTNGSSRWSIHLFCGGIDKYNGGNLNELPTTGENGEIIIKGTNKLGNIYAGSLSDVGTDSPDIPNEYAGEAVITIENGASEFGEIYAHGARESRGEADGDALKPSAELYIVSGDVTINLKNNVTTTIHGATGGNTDAILNYTDNGKGYKYEPFLENIGGIILNSYNDGEKIFNANLAPKEGSSFSSKGAEIVVPVNTRLNLTSMKSPSVSSFNGGGELILGQEQTLEITGEVSGSTKVAVGDVNYDGTQSESTITKGQIYIKAVNSDENCFTLLPHVSNTSLMLIKDRNGNWIAENSLEEVYIENISVEDTTVSMEDGQASMLVNAQYTPEDADISVIPFDISVNGTKIEVNEDDCYIYDYSSDIQFEMYFFYDFDENDEYYDIFYICPTSDTMPAGVYEISFTVPAEYMLSGQAYTTTATLTVTGDEQCEHTETSFIDNGDGTHSKKCKHCSNVIGTEEHTFDETGSCVCGASNVCTHSWTYTKNESQDNISSTITGICDCGEQNVITLTAPTGNSNNEIVYDGNVHKATVTQSLEEAEEITIVYDCKDDEGKDITDHNCTKAGNYTASITIGNQTAEVQWSVEKAKLTVIGAETVDKIYDGTKEVEVSDVRLDGILGTDDVSAELANVTGQLAKADAGTYTKVVISGLALKGSSAENYEITMAEGQEIDTNVTISPKDIENAVITLGSSLTYNGKEQTQTVTNVTDGTFVLSQTDYSISGNTITNAESYTLTVTGKGNFTGSVQKKFTVAKAKPTGSPKYHTFTEDGKTLADTGLTTIGGTFNTEGTVKWELAGITVLESGKAYNWIFTPNDATNFEELTGTVVPFTVCNHNWTYTKSESTNMVSIVGTCSCGAKNTITLSAPTGSVLTYDGSQHKATVTQSLADTENVQIVYSYKDWNGKTFTDHNYTKAGQYTASITVGNQTAKVSWNVNKAKLTVTKADVVSRAYDGTGNVQVTKVYLSGVKGSDNVSVNVANLTGEVSSAAAGTYKKVKLPTLTLQGSMVSNYELNFKGGTEIDTNVTISPKNIASAVITLGSGLTYNGKEQTQNVTNVKDGNLTLRTTDYTISGNKATNAGTYTLTVTGKGNFTGSVQKKFTVAKAKLTGTPKYHTYTESGKTLSQMGLTTTGGTFSTSGTVKWQLSGTTKAEAGKSYQWIFTPSDTKNYEILTGTAVFKAKQQVKNTAKNAEMTYGETYDVSKLFTIDKNAGKVSYSIVEGSSAVLKGTTLNLTKVGKVKIKAVTASTDTHLSGEAVAELTVKPKTVSAIVKVTKQYDGLNTAVITGVTLNGVLSGDKVSVDTSGVKAVYNSVNVGEKIGVTYTGTFKLTGEDAGNYTLTQPSGITGSIINTWKPAENMEYVVSGKGTDGIVKTKLEIAAKKGYVLSLTNTANGTWTDKIEKTEATTNGIVKFYVKNQSTGAISNEVTVSYKLVVEENNTSQKPQEKPENNTSTKPENKPSDDTGAKPENKPSDNTGTTPENKPNDNTNTKPENKPNDNTGTKPENKPNNNTSTKPENKPNNNTNIKPENKPNAEKNGLVQENGEWVYYEKGKKVENKTGLVLYGDSWFFVENGKVNVQAVGFVDYDGATFYVANGRVATEANGLVQDGVNWCFVANGQVQTQYTGLAQYDGAWFYVNSGKLDTAQAGYVEFDGSLFYVAVGQIKTEVNGLAADPNTAKWYYLANGQVQTQYTGLAQYDGAWFYVVNGALAEDYIGNVDYDGSTFYVVNGKLQ